MEYTRSYPRRMSPPIKLDVSRCLLFFILLFTAKCTGDIAIAQMNSACVLACMPMYRSNGLTALLVGLRLMPPPVRPLSERPWWAGLCYVQNKQDYLDFAVALVLFIVLVHVVYELAIKKRPRRIIRRARWI